MIPLATPTDDKDLADQAVPGHGVPSQDPNRGAQVELSAADSERETKSALVGGGVVAGAATGAAIGVAVAGPVGVLVGGSVGAIVGALGGVAAGAGSEPVSDAVHLHIEDSGGTGQPVVLIHGWPLSSASWSAQTAVLTAAGYRVVAYDRRGFGHSDKPETGYDYDTLADDLHRVLTQCELRNVTLVGFSMGGGEVARYVARHGESRLRSVVFAAGVPPYLMQSANNPDGPLTAEKAREKRQSLENNRAGYFAEFTRNFFSADGLLQVTDAQRNAAIALCEQSDQHAALACMDAFSTTDFREDLKHITVPTLVIHGAADAIVPFAGSGKRTHEAVAHSRLVCVNGAPHGLNVSHAVAFNEALLSFLNT